MPVITPEAFFMSCIWDHIIMTLRHALIIVMTVTSAVAYATVSRAADLEFGESLAAEQCNTCHVESGEMVGLGQAPQLAEVVQVVDWTHLRLREWFASGHPIRLSFQLTNRDLHDLRFYLMDLHDKSMLGTLSDP